MKYYALFILLCFVFPAKAQQRYYVSQQATNGQNTGQSWADAFTDLHLALGATTAGDEIWVAQGMYRTDTATVRNRAFVLRSGVRLLGGFAGTESSAEPRQPEQYATVLSGNIGNPNDSLDNALTVLYMAYPDSTTYISGFVIEHGYARTDTSFGNVSPSRAGGGAYILATDSTAYPLFDRCHFRNNYAGGNGGAVMVRGLNTKGCAPRFRHCQFINNKSGNNGGAVWYQAGSDVDTGTKFYGCDFIGNRAGANGAPGTMSGAVHYRKVSGNDTLSFKKCRFVENVSTGIAGCIAVETGSLSKLVTIDSCFISKNRTTTTLATYLAASFLNTDTDLSTSPYRVIRMANLEFNNQDRSSNRHTIYCSGDNNTISNVELSNCKYYNSKSTITLGYSGKCRVVHNEIYFCDSTVISSYNIRTKFENNIFIGGYNKLIAANNEQSTEKIGVSNNLAVASGPEDTSTSLLIEVYLLEAAKDTIIFNNNGFISTKNKIATYFDTLQLPNVTFIAQNNIFLNNTDAVTGAPRLPFWYQPGNLTYSNNMSDVDCATLLGSNDTCGDGNIVVSEWPFVDTANLDFRLRACAPGINGGTSAWLQQLGILKDLAGQPRIQGTAPDIGPYEQASYVISAQFTASASCAGAATGSALPSLSGGCPPYTFAWASAGAQGSGPSLTGLAAGQYTVTVRDASLNETVVPLTIPGYPAIVVPPPTIAPASVGQSNGSIILAPTGGLPPYAAQWSNGGTGLAQQNLAAGNYTVTITDGNGCTLAETYSVGTVAVDDQYAFGGFSLQPNPASDQIRVQGEAVAHFQVFRFDGSTATGRLLPNMSVPITSLSAGAYVVIVASKDGRRGRARLVVAR